MKREAPSELCGCDRDGEARLAKLRRCESSSTNPEFLKREHNHVSLQQPISPFSPDFDGKNPDTLAHPEAIPTSPNGTTEATTEVTDGIYQWIPAPSEIIALETMSQPASKRSRSRSISTDRGRARSVSSENSESSSARDAKSSTYRAVNYVTLRQKAISCDRPLLVRRPTTLRFVSVFSASRLNRPTNRSEARLLVDLHPLIMPSAENQFIRGNQSLKDVIDGYNDPWLKTEPIYGPKPQPDHARGLKWSTFSESQRRKLGIKPDEKSPYTAREDMYFPYLTAEIKCGNQALELADRQNMHSMCIALRAVVSLCQAAGPTEEVHRRILGFSISHELEGFRIYGYYPEVDDGKVSFYRWPVAQPNAWTKEDRWACYRFVENVDRDFLPIHTDRLMRILEEVPDPDEDSLSVDVDRLDYEVSVVGSPERPGYRRATSSQNRGLQPELRMMVQTLQQQLAEQKDREEKREAEQKDREEKREAEQKAREEKLLAQLEQQRKEQTVLQEKLFALL